MIKDTQFRKVENLKWLPFVGDNYHKMNLKTLVVGESHHYNPMEEINENFKDELFTRWIVDELGLCNREYDDTTKFFKTLNRMFADSNPSSFWDKIVFYNLIQREMAINKEQGINERPSDDDYKIAWRVFFDVVKVVQPDNCLICGTSMERYYDFIANELGVANTNIQIGEKINGAYYRYSDVIINNKQINLYFIKHPSVAFTSEKWLDKLKSENPELIESLT